MARVLVLVLDLPVIGSTLELGAKASPERVCIDRLELHVQVAGRVALDRRALGQLLQVEE